MEVNQVKITVGELTAGYVDNEEYGVRGYGGKLDIRPPYQREFIYKNPQRNAVIDTVEKGYPLNSMYWAVGKNGNFEIIDGQQRTLSLCHYIDGLFAMDDLFDINETRFFHNLDSAEKERILDYKLTVYQCSGEKSELLKWFETINIAGEELSQQELRNAVYSGQWVTEAKRHFSKGNCAAYRIGNRYLSGEMIRQKYLETAIRWISEGKIEEYMARHQEDENAKPLWDYFRSVIDWVEKVFPNYYKEMKGLDWGGLHRRFQNHSLDSAFLQKRIAGLMADEEVKSKRGIFEFVLSGDEAKLNLRAFGDAQKRTAFEKQGGKCIKCGDKFDYEEMEGDHITPWSKGGKTTDDNCQMLCKSCNRRKSDN